MAIRNNLPAVEAELTRLLRMKNEAAAILIENAAKSRAPVDTGRLRSSVTHDSDETGAVIGTNVEYAPMVHNGTRYQQPQPFLVDGLQQSIAALQGIYRS
jgi:HK97 gp10 family phage protein